MSKLLPLSEAIASYVTDGDTVYAAGFTHLIPFAAGHEIIRQGRKNLTLARATPDLEQARPGSQLRTDQLVNHEELAAMPETLHRVPRLHGTVLIIARDGMVVKRQLRFS